MSTDDVARLKVTMNGVKPTVMRRIEVPVTIRLDRLHLVLQAAIGWTNSHLYELSAGGARWGDPEFDDNDGPLDARKTRLSDVLDDVGTRTLRYLYDFGDGWDHTIKIEQVAAAMPGVTYPRLLEAVGRCPPEDVGGPWSYEEFLLAMADPGHERHAEFAEWIDATSFDPTIVDLETRARAVDGLATQWARKPARNRKRRG